MTHTPRFLGDDFRFWFPKIEDAIALQSSLPKSRIWFRYKPPSLVYTKAHFSRPGAAPQALHSSAVVLQLLLLHYTTLHYTTHYTTLPYSTLHYTTYTTLHYTTLHNTTLLSKELYLGCKTLRAECTQAPSPRTHLLLLDLRPQWHDFLSCYSFRFSCLSSLLLFITNLVTELCLALGTNQCKSTGLLLQHMSATIIH